MNHTNLRLGNELRVRGGSFGRVLVSGGERDGRWRCLGIYRRGQKSNRYAAVLGSTGDSGT